MCIAILKLADGVLDRDTLFECHKSNKDGCGLAYINSAGKMTIQKTMVFDTFMKMYEAAIADNPASNMLIHFRISTCGTVDEFNCHPFYIDATRAMMHNGGIAACRPAVGDKRNDTQIFNDNFIKTFTWRQLKHPTIRALMEKFIDHSKIVMLNVDGDHIIYGEEKGHWNEEKTIWYSNYGYVKTTYTSRKTNLEQDWDYDSYYYDDGLKIKWLGNQKYKYDYTHNPPKWRPITGDLTGRATYMDEPAKVIELPAPTHVLTNPDDREIQRRLMPVKSTIPTSYLCQMCIKKRVNDNASIVIKVERDVFDFNTRNNESLLCKECFDEVQALAAAQTEVIEIVANFGKYPEKG